MVDENRKATLPARSASLRERPGPLPLHPEADRCRPAREFQMTYGSKRFAGSSARPKLCVHCAGRRHGAYQRARRCEARAGRELTAGMAMLYGAARQPRAEVRGEATAIRAAESAGWGAALFSASSPRESAAGAKAGAVSDRDSMSKTRYRLRYRAGREMESELLSESRSQ